MNYNFFIRKEMLDDEDVRPGNYRGIFGMGIDNDEEPYGHSVNLEGQVKTVSQSSYSQNNREK